MKFQTMLLALSAISAGAACPAKPKPSSSTSIAAPATSSTVSVATPAISSTASVVDPKSSPTSSVAVPKTSSEAAVAAASAAVSSSLSSTKALAASSAAVSGNSTFYGGNLSGGMCSFTTMSSIPDGLYGTAFSGSAWDDAAECGACLSVTGPNGNSITVMVVDQCPECDEGHLDLFEDAFEQLGTKSAGIISTSYTKVPCGITSPIVLHNKSGTSAYWFSMQVVNHNEPISTLEVSIDGGSTWSSTTRAEYNFFENASGFGTDTVDVRVTSTSGGTITVSGVSVAADSKVTASSNFS
ncbi:Expansin-like protein 1 [Cytospora mali]|uniref:Expansin-like protein 1 n=1 Tax=Cytospora mali TaxID=578113 RepID=A0A194WCU9_CYTMA|nr:Expansin-like protein 1 [Valsa mali]